MNSISTYMQLKLAFDMLFSYHVFSRMHKGYNCITSSWPLVYWISTKLAISEERISMHAYLHLSIQFCFKNIIYVPFLLFNKFLETPFRLWEHKGVLDVMNIYEVYKVTTYSANRNVEIVQRSLVVIINRSM